MIDLEELLFSLPPLGEGTQEQDDLIREYFKQDEWCGEEYLVQAIERHLLTEDQRELIFKSHSSIEKMLNGRYNDAEGASFVRRIYGDWNKKIGQRKFGF